MNTKEEKDTIQWYAEHPIFSTTAHSWLKGLGFTYQTKKKSYYVDGHEFPEQKKSRNKFCQKYHREIEMNSHCWIQMTIEEDKTLREKKHIPENVVGTKILCEGKEMIEYHVDDCK